MVNPDLSCGPREPLVGVAEREGMDWAKAAFLAADVGIAVYDPTGRGVPLVNDAMLRLAGLSREEFENGDRSFIDATAPEFRDRDQRAREELIATGGVAPYRKAFLHADDKRVWVLMTAQHVSGSNVAVVTAQDLTALDAAERQAAQNESYLTTLMELSPQVSWITDAEGFFTHLSSRWTEWTGMSEADTKAYRWVELVHEEDRQGLLVAWQQSFAEGVPLDCEMRLCTLKRGYRWVRARAYPKGEGRARQWYGVTEDVHHSTIARLKQHELEAERANLAEAIPSLVWIADGNGEVTYYNSRLSRYAPIVKDATGRFDWDDLCHPDDLEMTQRAWQSAAEAGTPYECEHRLRMADGSVRWHQSRAVPHRNEAGRIARWIGAVTDIDNLKKALAQQEMLAHELDHRVLNAFSVVNNIVKRTLARHDVDVEVRKTLESRIRALAVAHGRLMKTTRQSANLADLVEELLKPFAPSRFSISGDEIDLSPQAATLLCLAIHELVTNAVKHGALSNETGKVKITWSVDAAFLALKWHEMGGPEVRPPQSHGFGTELLKEVLIYELGGRTDIRFQPTGLVFSLTADVNRLRVL